MRHIYRVIVSSAIDFEARVDGVPVWYSTVPELIHELGYLPSFFIIARPNVHGMLPNVCVSHIHPVTKVTHYTRIPHIRVTDRTHPNKYNRLIAGYPDSLAIVRLGLGQNQE